MIFFLPFRRRGTHLGIQLLLTAEQILWSPIDRISPNEARHLARLVSRHQANYTPCMKHLDEFPLDRSLYKLK